MSSFIPLTSANFEEHKKRILVWVSLPELNRI